MDSIISWMTAASDESVGGRHFAIEDISRNSDCLPVPFVSEGNSLSKRSAWCWRTKSSTPTIYFSCEETTNALRSTSKSGRTDKLRPEWLKSSDS